MFTNSDVWVEEDAKIIVGNSKVKKINFVSILVPNFLFYFSILLSNFLAKHKHNLQNFNILNRISGLMNN